MCLTKWDQAKGRLLIRQVFFGSIACSTPMKADKTCPTAYTDMLMIGYNPEFINSLDADTAMFVIVHELSHIIFKHGFRRHGRNPMLWNIACDYRINWWLKTCGLSVWDKALLDKRFAKMSEEQIYDLLQREGKGKGKGKDGGGGGGGGDDDDDGIGDDLRDPGELSPAQQADLDRQITHAVARAANMARMAGKFTGELERVVSGILDPQVPWYDLLRDYLSRTAQDDESWTRRNRRVTHAVLPGHYSERMGEIVVISDTSGSMNDEDFAIVAAELSEIVETVKPERVRVVWADDTECALEEIFEPGEPIVLHPKGGGGTDMRKPLKHIEQFEPIVAILITDGYTPWPGCEPPFPLIVCCTTNTEVPIGQVVRVTT